MGTLSIMAGILLSCFSQSGPGYAVVNLSVNFLREAPDYTAELGTQALMGSVVRIIGEDGYWKQVITEEPYTAWCTDLGLVEMSDTEIREYIEAPKYICTSWRSTVHAEASVKSDKICDLVEGDILRQGMKRGHPSMKNGFAQVVLPDGRTGYVRKKDMMDYARWEETRLPDAEHIIKEAMKFTGVPYLWGGASPNGVDCSGLVRHVFLMNGIELPRNASSQAASGKDLKIPVDPGLCSAPQDMETLKAEMLRRTESLMPGDLLFFGTPGTDGGKDRITHVGIYLGNGKMIHSSHVVRTNSLIPGEAGYYENSYRLIKACRILPDNDFSRVKDK